MVASIAWAHSSALGSNHQFADGDHIAADSSREAGLVKGRIYRRGRLDQGALIVFGGYRTPVLYSRNQSRTNTVLLGN